MANSQDRRKPFQGKKFHKDLRDYKNQEIKRSLVHRARLRKQYFKLLEEEGEAPPAPSKKEKAAGSEDEDSQLTDGSDELDSEENTVKLKAPLPPQRAPPKVAPKRKPLNFQERAKLAKDRKEQQREEKLRQVQERRRAIEQKQKERERKKESLSRKTKSGQPVMGPKINDLLDKIRSNQ